VVVVTLHFGTHKSTVVYIVSINISHIVGFSDGYLYTIDSQSTQEKYSCIALKSASRHLYIGLSVTELMVWHVMPTTNTILKVTIM